MDRCNAQRAAVWLPAEHERRLRCVRTSQPLQCCVRHDVREKRGPSRASRSPVAHGPRASTPDRTNCARGGDSDLCALAASFRVSGVDYLHAIWHALSLIADDVVSVGIGWLMLGVVLFELQNAVRTRGWFHIIRAAYPTADGLRARDVCAAYLAGSGLNGIVPARGGDVLKLWLVRRRAPGTRWSTLAATFVPETLFDTLLGSVLLVWAFGRGLLPLPPSATELPTLDVSLVLGHPLVSASVLAALCLLAVFATRRTRGLLSRLGRGWPSCTRRDAT